MERTVAPLNILLIEPFLGGSHARWAEGLVQYSRHKVQVMGLPGRHWKWRMHGGAVTLAEQFMEAFALVDGAKSPDQPQLPDLILATDMLDLNTFLSLTRSLSHQIPVAIYFHENQLTYPWSPSDEDVQLQRDNHYAFINYTSALAADHVFFNSQYHLDSFLDALPGFLRSFPDKRNFHTVELIREKCSVLYLGMDLVREADREGDLERDPEIDRKEIQDRDTPISSAAKSKATTKSTAVTRTDSTVTAKSESKSDDPATPPLLLWNHRWEYDKGPDEFFQTLIELKAEGYPFQLAVLGESYRKAPPIFERARQELADRIVQWGFSETGYLDWLRKADCLPVTSRQDFFGGSVVEAMYHNCWPILPDRLAYPEHIPEAFRNDCLYAEGQFKEALRGYLEKFVANGNSQRQTDLPQPHEWVLHYDWQNSAPQYDRAFGNLLSKG